MRIEEFELAWRWTQESYALFPAEWLADMEVIPPCKAAEFYSAGESLFPNERKDQENCCSATEVDVARRWLRGLPVAQDSRITIVWSRRLGVSCPWRIFTDRWDDFCYPSSDDAFIFLPEESGVVSYGHYEKFRYRYDVA